MGRLIGPGLRAGAVSVSAGAAGEHDSPGRVVAVGGRAGDYQSVSRPPSSKPRPSAALMNTLYWEYGLTLREVGAVFGMGYHTVRDRFQTYGIVARRPGARPFEDRPFAVKLALALWDRGMALQAIATVTKTDPSILEWVVRSRGSGVAVRQPFEAGSPP